jgi:thiamine pyrophosphate-dependent acetolactate synthase large subunit-like protein
MRSPELARRIKDEPADSAAFAVDPGTLDPRRVIEELDRVLPKDFDSVSGSGHQSYFHSVMRGRKPENYHAIRAFGAIGSGISYAIGVAAARRTGRVALFEGDGSFLMHIQELEMVQRHRLKLLFCIFNDGAYGAEIHKLRAEGVDDSGSVFGRTDLAAIAKGFGLRGANVTDVGQLGPLFDAYLAQDRAEVWNIHVSDKVVAPSTRRGITSGHGVR